jgi:hypothetical protein
MTNADALRMKLEAVLADMDFPDDGFAMRDGHSTYLCCITTNDMRLIIAALKARSRQENEHGD